MKWIDAQRIAAALLADLKPYCERIEIAGSLRREKPEVKDIELCAVPCAMDLELFDNRDSLFHHVQEHYLSIKPGSESDAFYCPKPDGKYWRFRIRPEDYHHLRLEIPHPPPDAPYIYLDLFLCSHDTWGMIFTIRTGSAAFSKRLVRHAHHFNWMSHQGLLRQAHLDTVIGKWIPNKESAVIPTHEEQDVFKVLGLPYIPPKDRETTDALDRFIG